MLRVERDVQFEVTCLWFDAEGSRARGMASGVRAVAQAVGVLEEVYLGGLLGGKVDVVGGCHRVVVVVFGAGGWRALVEVLNRHWKETGLRDMLARGGCMAESLQRPSQLHARSRARRRLGGV